jgi:acetylornithine deacetylase/succinyl-diaminopimelate desuccinylase-like protein
MTSDALQLLSRYIQFDTSHKNEMEAAQWLAAEIRERGVTQDVIVHEPAQGRGLVIAKVAANEPGPGSEPLKPLILNHHIDVVVADPAQWSHPPFAGEIANGHVYGRGALDDKGMGVVFLFALQELVQGGARFRRPIVFTAVPDEETHGLEGTCWLCDTHGATLDPEWVWDEGGAGLIGMFGPRTYFGLATSEKQVHLVRVKAAGRPGHGSMPHADNPNDKLIRALRWVLNNPRPIRMSETTLTMFRELAQTQPPNTRRIMERLDSPVAQRLVGSRLRRDSQLNSFVRDTISVNVVRGGEQANVIPEMAEALLDCRLLPATDPDEFDAWLRRRLGKDVEIEVLRRSPRTPSSPLDSPFYAAIGAAALAAVPGAGFFPLQQSGATDGRFWRDRGVPAYGMAPFLMTREDVASVHGIDERISGENLALGVQIAKDVLTRVCVT